MAPRIFRYEYFILSHLSIWLPGSTAGRLCEYRLIEPACSCIWSVCVPVDRTFTPAAADLASPEESTALLHRRLFGPVVDVPALEVLTRLCHLCYGCCLISAAGWSPVCCQLFCITLCTCFALSAIAILLEIDCVSSCAQHCPPFFLPLLSIASPPFRMADM